MSMNNNPAPKRKLDPWPTAIIAFFTVAIIGCISFVVFCSMHGTELVAKDYYEQEIRFQSEMERLQRAEALGDQASIACTLEGHLIQVRVPEGHAAGLTRGRIQLYRASSSGMDRSIELKPDAKGFHALPTADLAAGPWNVKVTWTADNMDYQMDSKVRVRSTVTGPNQ
jgi:nitrogen fixation protein FixH